MSIFDHPIKAAPGTRVAGRTLCPTFEPNGILVAVNPGFYQMKHISAGLPLHPKRLPLRDQKVAFFVARVRSSASAFIWASIRSSPVVASVQTAVKRPFSSKRGAKFLSSVIILRHNGCLCACLVDCLPLRLPFLRAKPICRPCRAQFRAIHNALHQSI